MFCNQCGKEIPNGVKFCPTCGAPVPQTNETTDFQQTTATGTGAMAGSGMGTAGLVGQIMTWQTMIQTESAQMVLIKILLIQIVLPAVVTLGVSEFMRKKDWIKMGDMKLEF